MLQAKALASPARCACRKSAGAGSTCSGDCPVTIGVIDGPYDGAALSNVLARAPTKLGHGGCRASPSSACAHGTFIMGLLGARPDAAIPGRCPDCTFIHAPLFLDDDPPSASVDDLAQALTDVIAAGARLINLSVAIVGSGNKHSERLSVALDQAERMDAVIVAAAGNQGREAAGQLLSHPVTVPVVAVDSERRLLPNCNTGPLIQRRGVAAFGYEAHGYAPGGGQAVMSGTSVAAAVATGTLAQLWLERPRASGAEIRAALARLAPRDSLIPPMIEREAFLAALDAATAETAKANLQSGSNEGNRMISGGNAVMSLTNERVAPSRCGAYQTAAFGAAVTPAGQLGPCPCGGQDGSCRCAESERAANYVYVLGTVDIRFADPSISSELQDVAHDTKVEQKPSEDLRFWCRRVLTKSGARYLARQLSWILTVEGQPAYYLALRDWQDLDDLISCLGEPKGDDLCLFVGTSSMTPVELCPGTRVPILGVDQFCFFKRTSLLEWFDMPEEKESPTPPSSRKPTAEDFFKTLVQSADNLGDTDQWRALNYLAVRYQPIYDLYRRMLKTEHTLAGIKVVKSRLWGEKRIWDVVFIFRHTKTSVISQHAIRLDLTYLFPMIVTPVAETFDKC